MAGVSSGLAGYREVLETVCEQNPPPLHATFAFTATITSHTGMPLAWHHIAALPPRQHHSPSPPVKEAVGRSA